MQSSLGTFVRGIAILAVSLLVACGGDDNPVPLARGGAHNGGSLPGGTAMLQPFASVDEFRSFTRAYSFNSGGIGGKTDTVGAPGALPTTGGAEGSTGTHSDTNVQEAGVDEPDFVKTNGELLFVASGSNVQIVDAVPAVDMHKVGEIAVAGTVEKLLLHGNKLVVLYRYTTPADAAAGASSKSLILPTFVGRTGVLVADVTDATNPVVERNEVFDGWLSTARRIDDALHLVLTFTPGIGFIGGVVDGGGSGGVVDGGGSGTVGSGGATPDNPAVVAVGGTMPALPGRAVDDPLDTIPQHYRVGANGALTTLGDLVDVSQILHPEQPAWLSYVEIVSVDLAQPQSLVNAVAYLGDSATVYASPQAMYLVQSESWFGVSPVVGVDGTVVAPAIARALAQSSVTVHKFALNGAAAQVVASGTVPGFILNQYALSEHDGFLRMATHDWEAATAVYVLEQVADELDIVGRIENIAPGENLFAARFLGDRGFLVTFERIDPLFTLDLSDPRAPRVVGELKVPGFSQYLHPLDANHLLAIGRSTRDDGGRIVPDGVQISLFDITDFANPVQKDVVTWPSGGWSDALYDPLAFNYWAERGLLAVPYTDPDAPPLLPVVPTNGVRVYDVDANVGFTRRGQLTITQGSHWSWARAVLIGDHTYYLRNGQIDVAATDALDSGTVATVTWPTPDGGVKPLPVDVVSSPPVAGL